MGIRTPRGLMAMVPCAAMTCVLFVGRASADMLYVPPPDSGDSGSQSDQKKNKRNDAVYLAGGLLGLLAIGIGGGGGGGGAADITSIRGIPQGGGSILSGGLGSGNSGSSGSGSGSVGSGGSGSGTGGSTGGTGSSGGSITGPPDSSGGGSLGSAAVPEPGTVALLGAFAIPLAGLLRFRRQNRK